MIILKSNLFIDKISLNCDKINSFDEYPFNIEIIKNFNELKKLIINNKDRKRGQHHEKDS